MTQLLQLRVKNHILVAHIYLNVYYRLEPVLCSSVAFTIPLYHRIYYCHCIEEETKTGKAKELADDMLLLGHDRAETQGDLQ